MHVRPIGVIGQLRLIPSRQGESAKTSLAPQLADSISTGKHEGGSTMLLRGVLLSYRDGEADSQNLGSAPKKKWFSMTRMQKYGQDKPKMFRFSVWGPEENCSSDVIEVGRIRQKEFEKQQKIFFF